MHSSFRSAFRGSTSRLYSLAPLLVATGAGALVCSSESKKANCAAAAAGPSEDQLAKYRPSLTEYTRIDSYLHEKPEYAAFRSNHAMHETLRGDKMIQNYEIYKKEGENEVYCILSFGHALNGYRGVLHGGITALCMDNTFGWLFASSGLPLAVTANLTVNYKSPIYENSTVILKAKVDSVEGRKIKMSAVMVDPDTQKPLAECTTLFITSNKKAMVWYYTISTWFYRTFGHLF